MIAGHAADDVGKQNGVGVSQTVPVHFLTKTVADELMHRRDVPPRVSLSEYTAIAYAFFTGKEPGLANGVLNHLAHMSRDGDL